MAVFKADSHPDLPLLPDPETRPAPSPDKAQQTPRAGPSPSIQHVLHSLPQSLIPMPALA